MMYLHVQAGMLSAYLVPSKGFLKFIFITLLFFTFHVYFRISAPEISALVNSILPRRVLFSFGSALQTRSWGYQKLGCKPAGWGQSLWDTLYTLHSATPSAASLAAIL